MANTWTELIRDALIEIGVKEPGESLDSDESADTFRRLQGMLDEWGLEGLMVPGMQRVNHTFTTSQTSYTMGPAQDDDDDNPDIVTSLTLEQIVTFNYRLAGDDNSRPINSTSYSVLSENRSFYAGLPTLYYWDKTYPFSRLHFNRLPYIGDRVEIAGRGHFNGDIEIGDDITDLLPKGYREGVMLNLAVKIAPSYGVKEGRSQGLSRETRTGAMKGKRLIRRRNLRPVEARIDPALHSYRQSDMLSAYGSRR